MPTWPPTTPATARPSATPASTWRDAGTFAPTKTTYVSLGVYGTGPDDVYAWYANTIYHATKDLERKRPPPPGGRYAKRNYRILELVEKGWSRAAEITCDRASALCTRNVDVTIGTLVKQALGKGPGWRRHVPPALFLLACTVMLLAAARPVAHVPLPWARSTIILAMDVSLSMRVADVLPTRMVAAQEAAKTFLRDLPRDIEVGLVTFAGSTQVAQQGMYQQMMTGRVAQMVTVALARGYPCVPEISANKYALNIRFTTQEGMQRPKAAETDVEFELTFCNL